MSTETERFVIELAPSVRMAFRLIPPGSFVMGARGEPESEEPMHRVKITRSFWLGETSVTQEQFAEWTRAEGVKHKNENANKPGHPAVSMDWFEATHFCLWLTGSGLLPSGCVACLPTEAEWEYACRGGTETDYHTGDGAEALTEAGWFGEAYEGSAHPVRLKQANAFGLFDMHGNVWEWCQDAWDGHAYCSRVDGVCDPGWAIRGADYREKRGIERSENNPLRVLRGGSWFNSAGFCRSADRLGDSPVFRGRDFGFRVCLVPGPSGQRERGAPKTEKAEPASGAGVRGTRTEAKGAGGAGAVLSSEKMHPAQRRIFFSENDPSNLMNTTTQTVEPRAIFSADGQTWLHNEGTGPVGKIVIGTPPKAGEEAKPVELSAEVKRDLVAHLPTVTHLHLWQVKGLKTLPALPTGLKCLDVRGCAELESLPELPAGLETLVIDGCPLLRTIPLPAGRFPKLRNASMKGCLALEEASVNALLDAAPKLRRFDASDCPVLSSIQQWPDSLDRIEMNGCAFLTGLPAWPPKLRCIGLRRATSLPSVPDLPATADYVDLAYTEGLLKLPVFRGKPRTLFLFGSGVAVNPALYGKADEENVASAVWADRGEARHGIVPDNEVKVILLGNGRCGKSSLARRWVEGAFKKDEPSTHGIRLWKKAIDFVPVESGDGREERAKLNIWDFAGQDLYHNTHRLFLQSRAIFILCFTDSGPGYDEASDKTEREKAEDDEDVHRRLGYWHSQVEALGQVPGIGGTPPVLAVRTKSNRRPNATFIPGVVDFSAETGDGMDEIERWVADAVGKMLGRHEARAVPVRVMAVKAELAALMEANDEAHKESEETRRPGRSPHPDMAYESFAEVVRCHCPGSEYAKNPRLLLERFHRNGFVFYDEPHLPGTVILDQRWAVDAIYTFSNRESDRNIRERLLHRNGRFTLSLLANKVWTPAGYPPEKQLMVLGFMLACGMCFELLRPSEAAAGEAVYAAPGFFPSRADMLERMPELAAGPVEAWAHYPLQNVAEAEMMSVLSNLGAAWSRAADLWRWGATVAANDSGCRVLLDWQRATPDDYTGTLMVWFTGRVDRAFEREVLERLKGICADRVTLENIHQRHGASPVNEMEVDPADARMPTGKEQRRIVPDREAGVGVRVTFSYAGSDAISFPRIGDVPSLLGAKLRAQFERDRRGAVICYDQVEGEERLTVFTESLAKGDLMLVFWSEKYWQSVYCCTEMMLIYEAPPEGRLLDHRVAIWVIDGGRISQSGRIRGANFENGWVERATKREAMAEADAKGDLRRKRRFLQQDKAFHNWYEFVLQENAFDHFVVALREYRLGRPLAVPANAADAESIADRLVVEVNTLLWDPVTVLDLAMQRLEQGRKEDAVWLLFQFLAKNACDERNAEELIQIPGNYGVPQELLAAAREVLGIKSSK